jgi:hypothetical protein
LTNRNAAQQTGNLEVSLVHHTFAIDFLDLITNADAVSHSSASGVWTDATNKSQTIRIIRNRDAKNAKNLELNKQDYK